MKLSLAVVVVSLAVVAGIVYNVTRPSGQPLVSLAVPRASQIQIRPLNLQRAVTLQAPSGNHTYILDNHAVPSLNRAPARSSNVGAPAAAQAVTLVLHQTPNKVDVRHGTP